MNSPAAEPSDRYLNSVTWLYDRINFERATDQNAFRTHFRLARMERLLVELDNPQQFASLIHIAGSKGKGSVAWLTAESLRHAGYRVGLYTSPHLLAIEERFVVDGRPITQLDFARSVEAVRSAAERIADQGHGHATFFELTTAMAWWLFRDARVDFNVIEVGLGGRLDSTNVCVPALSIITSISYDHQMQLGDTLAQIAFEKAGIIKPGVPVVSGAVHPEASEVIRRIAGERDAQLRELQRDFAVHSRLPSKEILRHSHFDFHPNGEAWPAAHEYEAVELSLLGAHQIANAALVLAGLEILREQGRSIPETAVRRALKSTSIAGRIQIVSEQPLVILDTAHNEASIAALLETLDRHFPNKKRTFIFASSRDKKWKIMLEKLLSSVDRMVLTQFRHNPRAVPLEQLVAVAHEIADSKKQSQNRLPSPILMGEGSGVRASELVPTISKLEIFQADSPPEAFQLAQKIVPPDEMIIIAGSFFLAGEILESLPRGFIPS
jgi:dihydrofolate synthase/folylpolyglutamate synthase